MIKIAVYGKGGIGKSTTVSNLSVALAETGLQALFRRDIGGTLVALVGGEDGREQPFQGAVVGVGHLVVDVGRRGGRRRGALRVCVRDMLHGAHLGHREQRAVERFAAVGDRALCGRCRLGCGRLPPGRRPGRLKGPALGGEGE